MPPVFVFFLCWLSSPCLTTSFQGSRGACKKLVISSWFCKASLLRSVRRTNHVSPDEYGGFFDVCACSRWLTFSQRCCDEQELVFMAFFFSAQSAGSGGCPCYFVAGIGGRLLPDRQTIQYRGRAENAGAGAALCRDAYARFGLGDVEYG